MSSNDLINWRNHPDALIANSKEEGAFSGGAFIDDDGKAILSYWKISAQALRTQSTGIPLEKVWQIYIK